MTDQPENMMLWSQVCTTDPQFTKEVQKTKSYKFTTINPTYQTEQATRIWGPYGKPRWWLGYTPDELIIGKELVVLYATFHYPDGEFPISNCAKLRGKYNIDDDVLKKLETDTLTKALSRLGFGADIFQGQWDAHRYVNAQQQQYHQQQPQGYNNAQPQQGYPSR